MPFKEEDFSFTTTSSQTASSSISYCTPTTHSAIESLHNVLDLDHLELPPNIWSTSYTNIGSFSRSHDANFSEKYTTEISPRTIPRMVVANISDLYPPQSYERYHDNYRLQSTQPHRIVTVPQVELKPRDYYFKDYLGNYFHVSNDSKFFVIKSFNLTDVNALFINNIWALTEFGNKRLSKSFKACGSVYLFFLVNSSGKFCGIAKMTSDIDFSQSSDVWAEMSKWKGIFKVEWLLVKDVPNKYFLHFKIAANDNKPVTNSRDTQEIPFDIGISMFKIFSSFKHSSSFLI